MGHTVGGGKLLISSNKSFCPFLFCSCGKTFIFAARSKNERLGRGSLSYKRKEHCLKRFNKGPG